MSSSLSADAVTDSIFTWTFTASTGDSWGGSLVDDGTRYEVGSTLATAFGRYTIVAEEAQGADLGGFGFNEGWIAVAWYRDRSGLWMLTQNGEGIAAGQAGLGSELDAAWNGSAWDGFGLGGADQADPADLADSLFTWTFTAASGDVMQGTLLADTRDWNAGDTLRTAFGTYRIDTESAYGQDLGGAGLEGTVQLLSYSDFYAGIEFPLETGSGGAAGSGGLGSEWDRAWTGSAWVPVGQGGALQADRVPDRVFMYRFTAQGGDQYVGSTIGHSTAFVPGDGFDVAHGRYTILREVPFDGAVAQQGMTWVFGYYDASVDIWMATYQLNIAGTTSGLRGLGSEYDYAWDGDEWDDFGLGGVHLASIERDSLFAWTFTARNGDRYGGWLVDNDDRYAVADVIDVAHGRYRIDYETGWGGDAPRGSVWTTYYHDAPTGRVFDTYNWATAGGQPAGRGGLGSEYDYIWDGDEWDDFGVGGVHSAGVVDSALHAFTFTADSGDIYSGWLIDDAARYAVGDTWRTALGSYRITYETSWGGTAPRGTVYTTSYYDAPTGRSFDTYFWGTLGA
jgi:hypothetical protein